MKNFQDLTFNDYFRILRRRIWYVIVTTALVSGVTTLYVWRLPLLYKSETTIMVSSRLVPEDYIGTLVRETVADRIDFVRQQLHSRSFAEQIIQEFQLAKGQANIEGLINGILGNTEITMLSANTFKVAYTSNIPAKAQSITKRLAEKVLQLNESVRKEKVQSADQFLDEQAQQAASEMAAAEEKVRRFNRQNFPSLPEDQIVSIETLDNMERQLATVTADLGSLLDTQKSLKRRLAEQQELKTVLQQKVQSTLQQARNSSSTSGSGRDPQPSTTELERKLISKRGELNTATARYTQLHPDVIRLKREVEDLAAQVASQSREFGQSAPAPISDDDSGKTVAAVPSIDGSEVLHADIQVELEQVARDIAKKEQAKNDLAVRVSLFRKRLNLPSELAQQLTTLTRDLDAAKQRYNYLSGKKLSSELAGSVDASENNSLFKIVDPANLPTKATWPDRVSLLSIGFLLSIGLGVGAAFIREFADSTFADENEISARLKLPVLGTIPEVAKAAPIKGVTVKPTLSVIPHADDTKSLTFSLQHADPKVRGVIFDPATLAGEQYRVVRANLSTMRRQNGLKTLLVASTIPNEGKTFVAACLAGIMAQEADRSVCLVDADMRTGHGSKLLGLQQRKADFGLSDILSGSAKLEDALMRCAELNLRFLSSGNGVANPTELLCLPEFEGLLNDLSQRFDWIIIDSPPVLALADVSLLVPVCDAALMVIRAEKTSENVIRDAVRRIGEDHICGVVLNGARTIKSSNDYYKYYHRQVR